MALNDSCEQARVLAPAYALQALSGVDKKIFEAHLENGCSVCESELLEYESVVGCLGLAGGEELPPPTVRQKLLDQIESIQRGSAMSEETNLKTRYQAAGTRDHTGIPWTIAAAFLVLLAGASIAWISNVRSAARMRSENIELQQTVDQLQMQLELQQSKVEDFETASRAMNDPSVKVVSLSGQADSITNSATVRWDVQNHILVVTTSLPAPPEDKVYQVWLITPSDQKISAGLLQRYTSDCVFTTLRVPQDLERVAFVAITLEPAGGSAQPTMPIYAAGRV